jgi:hypothetical protein
MLRPSGSCLVGPLQQRRPLLAGTTAPLVMVKLHLRHPARGCPRTRPHRESTGVRLTDLKEKSFIAGDAAAT